MNLRNAFGALTLVIILGIAASGQLATEDPFPETGQQEDAVAFDTKKVRLHGVITQKVTPAIHSPSYLFFRMQVTQGRVTTVWTIRLEPDPKLLNIAKNCSDCLVNEYNPVMLRLDVGRTVTVTGYQSRADDNRLAKITSIMTSAPDPN